jgi:hypothetical protein
MALALQGLHRQIAQGRGKGLRLGVGVDYQYLHKNFL